jgi:quinol monooxygenase YgiN
MIEMLTASRAEDGCIVYSYGFDVAEPGLIRVFEIWRDQAALDAHFKTEHMARWRAAGAQFGVSDRRISVYEVASERAI